MLRLGSSAIRLAIPEEGGRRKEEGGKKDVYTYVSKDRKAISES